MGTDDRSGVWQKSTRALLDGYRDAEREALALPTDRISYGDNREQRERWVDRNIPIWHAAHKGEIGPIFVVAPLVRALLASHIRRRLDLLRRAVLVSNDLPQDAQDALLCDIDRQLASWPAGSLLSRIATGFFTFVLPLGAPLLLVLKASTGVSLSLTFGLVAGLLAYSFVFLSSAASAKRALLLGGSAKTSLSPDEYDGLGVYGIETQVFGPLAPPRREFPLDVATYGLTGGCTLVLAFAFPGVVKWILLFFGLTLGLLAVFISIISFRARRRLGRW